MTAVKAIGAPVAHAPAAHPSAAPPKPRKGGGYAGRSPFYGVIAWTARLAGGLTGVALVQLASIATVLLVALRRLGIGSHRTRLAAVAVVSTTTTLPVFGAVVMPDVFAMVVPLALGMLFAFGRVMGWGERAFWLISLLLAVLFHKAFLIVAIGLFAALMCIGRLRRVGDTRDVLLIAGALAVAVGGTLAIDTVADRLAGVKLIPTPFLLARAIGDGPAAQVLRDECPARGWVTCRFVPALPLTENQFLWNSQRSVPWELLPEAERSAISAEQGIILTETLRRYPLAQAQRSLANAIRQFVTVDLNEFYDLRRLSLVAVHWDPATALEFGATRIVRDGDFPLGPLGTAWKIAYLLATAVLAAGLFARRHIADAVERRIDLVLLTLLISLFGHAAVTGVLAGVFGRYQGRIAPLAMIGAIVVLHRLVLIPRAAAVARVPSSAV